jgi:hypothetical protein
MHQLRGGVCGNLETHARFPDRQHAFSSKGNRLGRPRVSVPQANIERLKREGLSLRAIAKQVGVSKTTILPAMYSRRYWSAWLAAIRGSIFQKLSCGH